MDWIAVLLTPLAAYLIGSVPFGYLIARARGVDIFKHGSGNIGATNVARTLGRPLGVLVFTLDFAKGAIPVLAALAVCFLWPVSGHWWQNGWLEVIAGLAAFIGHLFPVYLGFHGGKGVATGAGIVAVLVPVPALAALGFWMVGVVATRYVSLASILAVLGLTAVQLAYADDWTSPQTIFCLLAGVLIVVKHRSNIARLMHGHENQLRENPAMIRVSKSMHVLALGLWFGAAVFFTFVAAPLLFSTFEQVGEHEPRKIWFPLTPPFGLIDDSIHGPREQGVRAAGYAVGPMFPRYFLLQAICAFIATITALPWARLGGVHRWRLSLLLTALTLVLAGWAVEQHVDVLREPRNETTETYLIAPTDAHRDAMTAARRTFGMWHGVSLMLNFAAIALVTATTTLAAYLPGTPSTVSAIGKEETQSVPEPTAGS